MGKKSKASNLSLRRYLQGVHINSAHLLLAFRKNVYIQLEGRTDNHFTSEKILIFLV